MRVLCLLSLELLILAGSHAAQAEDGGPAPTQTTLCQFNQGPKAGTGFDFGPYGVRPFSIGRPCTDFQGSTGIAGTTRASVASLDPVATPASSPSPTLTTVCQFKVGPKAGTAFDFKPFGVQPIAVGRECTDFQGSSGISIP